MSARTLSKGWEITTLGAKPLFLQLWEFSVDHICKDKCVHPLQQIVLTHWHANMGGRLANFKNRSNFDLWPFRAQIADNRAIFSKHIRLACQIGSHRTRNII